MAMTAEQLEAKRKDITTNIQFVDVKLLDIKADKKRHGFKGYAATWDLDQVNDVIVRGAFADTIRERGPREDGRSDVKVLWQHNRDIPIGLPTLLREDDAGLYVEAELAKTFWGNEVYELIAGDVPVIDMLSIGYITIKHEYDSETEIFYLKTLKLYEFSPVTFPANMAAAITGAKGADSGMAIAKMFGIDVKTIEALHCLQEIIRGGANVEDLKKALAPAAAHVPPTSPPQSPAPGLHITPPNVNVPTIKGSQAEVSGVIAGWLKDVAAEMKTLNERR